jgi:HlyD family secretion protein
MPDQPNSKVLHSQPRSQLDSVDFDHHDVESSNQQLSTSPPSEPWFYATHELLDSLPRLWSRGLLYFLIIFSIIILPWAMLSKVDETGSARGRLEPKGRSARLDASVAGTVTSIKVKEGESVKSGQVVLELEAAVARADLQQAESKLEGQMNRLTQLELLKNQLAMATQTQRLQNQAQTSAQLAQINQTKQQLNFNQASLTLTQELLGKDRDRVTRYRKLGKDGVIPGAQVEDAERALIESQQRLEKVQTDIQQSETEFEKQQQTYEKGLREGELTLIEAERRIKELQTQISDLTAEVAQTKKQIESLQFQLQQRVLRAPIAGTIFQLPIKDTGTVVQPGTLIAQIAPQESSFVLKAEMVSQESGFLQLGQPVKIKFDAYPFQDYGIVEGRLNWISPDSKVKDTNQGRIETFDLEIVIDHPYIQTPTRRISLTPGQTATAEVITRQRHVIDFILDPFKKLQKDGLKL